MKISTILEKFDEKQMVVPAFQWEYVKQLRNFIQV